MVKQVLRAIASAIVMAGFMLAGDPPLEAQTVSAVPQFDLGGYMGAWYEVARYPDKREKTCTSDVMVLYAPGDKPNRFQMVTSCQIKADTSDAWNASGRIDKARDGRLTITYLWPFKANYWVLATGPASEWLLIGSPNRKTLWVLSRTAAMTPEVLAEIEAKAVAEGFTAAKLAIVPQRH